MHHILRIKYKHIKKKEATTCDVLFTPKLHCNRDGRFPVIVALDYLWRGNNKFQTKILSYFNSLLKRINENFASKTSVCDITLENLLVSSQSDVFESALKNKKLSFREDEFDSIVPEPFCWHEGWIWVSENELIS